MADPARIELPAAIVHDWFQGYHGSERVVDVMRADLFEDAPDILTFVADQGRIPTDLGGAIRHESGLARLPWLRPTETAPGHWRYLLPLMPHYFRSLDLDRYDVVVASSHACVVQVRPRKDAVFVCYCHTPMRYAWLPELESDRTTGAARLPLRLMARSLRRSDLKASRRPDSYVANSTAVRDRIRRFYGRDAVVIHPPVETTEFFATLDKEPGRFLWVNRLVSYKQPELVIEAFRDSPFRLTMVGVGPLEKKLRGRLPANVEIRPWVDRADLVELFGRASGFIHVGEEDFGISMVEALAAGTPVIALARGGALDIVRPEQDGLLIEQLDIRELRSAIQRVAATAWDPAALALRAAAFGRERFVSQMRAHVAETASAKGLRRA